MKGIASTDMRQPVADAFLAPVAIHAWRIAPTKRNSSYVSYPDQPALADPTLVVAELRQRVDTLSALGMVAIVCMDDYNGELQLWARERAR